MSEWKYLKDGVPLDWWTNEDYEIEYYDSDRGWFSTKRTALSQRHGIVLATINGDNYRYRIPQPPEVTHEKIMTLWWKIEEDSWVKVTGYNKFFGYHIGIKVEPKDWFKGRESSILPPEVE